MSTEAKVGAFVLASLAILLGTIYRLTNMQMRGARVPYRTYLRYAGGLEPGADVLFGGRRGASFDPMLMEMAGLVMIVTDPSFATELAFTGVPCLMSNRISIRVGSCGSGRTAVTVPTLMPPNRTSAPGSNPPAYRRYVR